MRKPTVATAVLVVIVVAFAVYKFKSQPSRPPLGTPTPDQIRASFPGSSRITFDQCDKFILLSLDPSWNAMMFKTEAKLFHGFRILGQTEIKNNEERQQLRRLYYDGLVRTDYFSGACFNPTYGIQAVKKANSLDLLLSSRCGYAKVFVNGEEHKYKLVKWASAHQPEFNKILTAANVPIAEPKR